MLSSRQACTQLGISMRELRALKQNGRAPENFNITPRTVRYLSTSVDHFHTKMSVRNKDNT